MRWWLASAVAVGAALLAGTSHAQEPTDRPHVNRPTKRDPRPKPTGTGTLRVPAPSMAPTVPAGATVQVDYDAYGSTSPAVGDVVIIRPPRGADWSGRCGVATARGQMCPRPVRRLSRVKFLKRVVALPGDRLRMRGGLIERNGAAPDDPFANVSSCDRYADCDFPREIAVPAEHYFVLGDNRGQSDDSRFWGPVPRRALLAKVTACTTESGDPCGALAMVSP